MEGGGVWSNELLGAALQWWLHGITPWPKPMERTTSRTNSDVSRALQVMVMCGAGSPVVTAVLPVGDAHSGGSG